MQQQHLVEDHGERSLRENTWQAVIPRTKLGLYEYSRKFRYMYKVEACYWRSQLSMLTQYPRMPKLCHMVSRLVRLTYYNLSLEKSEADQTKRSMRYIVFLRIYIIKLYRTLVKAIHMHVTITFPVMNLLYFVINVICLSIILNYV